MGSTLGRLAGGVAVAWLAAMLAVPARAAGEADMPETDGARAAFAAHFDAGDYGRASEAGRPAFEALVARHPQSTFAAGWALADTFRHGRDLVLYKVDRAARDEPGPFLCVSPTARELFGKIGSDIEKIAHADWALVAEDDDFASRYVRASLLACVWEAADAYARLEAEHDGERAGAIRPYLSALVLSAARDGLSGAMVGIGGEDMLPAVVAALSERLGSPRSALFLVEDALEALGDPEAAVAGLEAIEGLTAERGLEESPDIRRAAECAESWEKIAAWALTDPHCANALAGLRMVSRWGMGIRSEEAAAEVARITAETERRRQIALDALGRVVRAELGERSEAAALDMIRVRAELMLDFAGAAVACGEFLERFAQSEHAPHTIYRKALYEYRSRSFDATFETLSLLESRTEGAELADSALVLKGLAHAAAGRLGEAIAAYTEVLDADRSSALAGKAQYLIGAAYLSSQRYGEAREAFQRVIDFYPGDAHVEEARTGVEKLSKLPQSKE